MLSKSCALVATAILGVWLQAVVQSPAAPSLQEQLEAQYQVSKMQNGNACALTVTGTALRIQKPGVFAVPANSAIGCAVKYEDGKIGSPNPFCRATVKQFASFFREGHRVYVLKIDANAKKDKVAFNIVSCSDQGASWKGEVVFQFPKDYLEKASVPDIEDKIGELLALDNDNGTQAQGPSSGQDQNQPQTQGPSSPDAMPPAAPFTIRIGQTQQEVEAGMGPPEKRVDLGARQIYLYKNLKVTFVDGKVADVQ